LTNGKQFAIAVFVSNSKENIETNERIIAEIAKASYGYITRKLK
jgi:beta-lactamase class A